jgi:hypothetical protein
VKSGEVIFFTHKQKKACARNMVSSNVYLRRKAMKRKTTALRYTLLTAALISLPSLAQAALLTYEGFGGYPNATTVHGSNGGQGWNGGWVVQGSQDGINYPTATSNPLTFGPLVTSPEGSYLLGGVEYKGVGRQLNTNAWQAANYGVSGGNINSGTFWFSMLAQINTTDNINFTFSSDGTSWVQGNAGNVRIRTTYYDNNSPNPGAYWELGTVANNTNQTTNIQSAGTRSNNTTYFVVARFHLDHLNNTASTFHLWVTSNPNSLNLGGPDLDLTTANAVLTNLNAASVNFRNFNIFADTGGANSKIDEIRFGQTFADVSPIPEPSTYALLAAGLGALVWLRRRAKAKV